MHTPPPRPDYPAFIQLIEQTTQALNKAALADPTTIQQLKGNKLEPYVHQLMTQFAIGTTFEGTIELIGGQKFPDIVVKDYYGVEVKTTSKNHWKTTGNSVLESTRVPSVERIFILFGKLASPIEFRCRPYEACLSEIVVTHAPRYLIDMNLPAEQTIFDKLAQSYNELRQQERPIQTVVQYYKSQLKPGQNLWWIEQDDMEEAPTGSRLVIDLWSELSRAQKAQYICQAMAYFPELFGNGTDKFARFAIWLITQEGIVCPNVRDAFTAGGKGALHIGTQVYPNSPRVFLNLFEYLPRIQAIIETSETAELEACWKRSIGAQAPLELWVELVAQQGQQCLRNTDWNLYKMLRVALNLDDSDDARNSGILRLF